MGVKKHLIIIAGPTGSGKTNLALSLLDRIDGEIVSADSRQVYSGIDFGTNKLRIKDVADSIEKHKGYWVQRGQRINNYDIVLPNESFDVTRFIEISINHINRIWDKGELPVIVGGTGFYIDTLIGLSPLSLVGPDEGFRQLMGEVSLDELQTLLGKQDPEIYSHMSSAERSNRLRLIRYLELVRAAGSVKKAMAWSSLKNLIEKEEVNVRYIGLVDDRLMLYQRADQWVDELLASDSLLNETKYLMSLHGDVPILNSIIYAPCMEHNKGLLTRSNLSNVIKGQLHHYIRRQLIWFRRRKQVEWIDLREFSTTDSIINSKLRDITTH